MIAFVCRPTLCTIMEPVIKGQVLEFLLNTKLISQHQIINTVSNAITQLRQILPECTHDWIVGLSNGNQMDVISA